MKNETVTAPPEKKQEQDKVWGFLDAADLAARLGVGVGTIRKWTKDGEIPAIRFKGSRSIRYDGPSVREALLRKQRGGE